MQRPTNMVKEINQSKPNLFIVGAPKSGTTFLYERLKNNEELFFPKIKELNFFSYETLRSNSYYQDYKIEDINKYLGFYKTVKNEKYIIDPSVSYFADKDVPSAIFNFNPDSKIVIILRNPIKRAYSHYLMDIRMGYAHNPLKEYIDDEKSNPHFVQYIQNSLYFENISNYLKFFKKENICVFVLENIEDEISKLYQFLEIDRSSNLLANKKVNESKTPSNFVGRYMQKNRHLASILKMVIPNNLSEKFKGLFYKPVKDEPLSDENYKLLFSHLKQDVEKLSQLLNKDFFKYWKL